MRLVSTALMSLGTWSFQVCEAQLPMRGYGVHTCSEYLDISAENGQQPTDIMFGSWAMGFMSSLNIAAMSSSRKLYHDLGSATTEEQMTKLRDYCTAHRDEKFWQAVIDLYNSLPTHPYP